MCHYRCWIGSQEYAFYLYQPLKLFSIEHIYDVLLEGVIVHFILVRFDFLFLVGRVKHLPADEEFVDAEEVII